MARAPAARRFARRAHGTGAHLPPPPRSPGMMLTLVRKLLRDVRLPLLVLIILLAAFQCLWIKVAQRISGNSGLLRQLVWLGEGRHVTPEDIENEIFEGPGKIVKTMI